ncbi:MAG TPA: hypothetical protein VE890_09375, partial [Thermoguttaceae bacterium]|nr:hypothetical protein [Thermoguttaceae bacterium]
GQTATSEHYTNYVQGINGLMIDAVGLTNPGDLSAIDDFEFRVGNTSDLATWSHAPMPLPVVVRPGAGIDGSDRITIIFDDHAIERQWIEVTVRATANTGLSVPDVFYFGNAPGEAGDKAANTIVNATDEILARNFQHSAIDPAPINDPFDYNRDGLVNGSDQIIARNNQTNPLTMLRLITAAAVDLAVEQAAMESPNAAKAAIDWQYEYDRAQSKNMASRKNSDIEATVDMLLATD